MKDKIDSKKLIKDLETAVRELKNIHSERAGILEKIASNNEKLAQAPTK